MTTKFKKVSQASHNLPGNKTQEVYRVGNDFIRLTRSTRANVDVELFEPFAESLKDDIAAQAAIDSMLDDIIAAYPRRLKIYHACRKGRTLKPGKIPADYAAFFVNRALFLSNYQAEPKRLTRLVIQKLNGAKERNEHQTE